MDGQKKPRAREKRIAEGSMSVEKHGEGMGNGPVGNTGGYHDRREQEAAQPKVDTSVNYSEQTGAKSGTQETEGS